LPGKLRDILKRIFAIIQIVIVLIIVGYATVNLYRGNFEQAIAAFPLLVVYYLLLLSLVKRKEPPERKA